MIMKRFTWPAELTLNLIGGKWKSLILHRLLEGESRRFGELKRLLPGISAKMLAKHLKELEFDGLIARLEVPPPSGSSAKPRILYTPTNRSRSLTPILDAIQNWGSEHLVDYGNVRPSGTTGPNPFPGLSSATP
jgi:DNA-binding HxlR family transcriptional regulator